MSNVKMSRNPKDVKKVSTICHVPKDVTMDTITFFFINFLLDQGPLRGATDCSCFGLRVSFLMGFKS